MSTVSVRAAAKINLHLGVGAVRDDGFHPLDTVYQAISLYDDVTLTGAVVPSLELECADYIDAGDVPIGGGNIAFRALEVIRARTGRHGHEAVEILKSIPVAGGMAGGSADAAATLLACDHLWGTGLGREELHSLAAELGADVPFALMGGTAVGTGRGDALSPALAQGTFHWVLALSEAGLSTPEVYAELDRHRERHVNDIAPAPEQPTVDIEVLQALRAGDPHQLAEYLHNDLQAPALHLEPGLARTLEAGEKAGALAGIVSGSGPTVAFLVADADAALELQVELSAGRHTVIRATGPVHGARVVAG
ncbi:MAG: 4-(cytidine 5'-diphospho)-2-C-methyl-D-erythritol kinase [Microcella sp.]|uniref:4-(cytidine 5'-diphospho)-2-C-methyl-D-erythritol kinase n=1 Tax=Microcella sp. TaxID=1913979 RepID=UPI002716ECF2|nr:4-(cytidine 5'-diphospho)-2-C-methyl-D-erythritol kinase [Microcella sp.]MDO8338166.1 4-(cytidine 5'-diphospho)-2-C-methyl-D-erythritol kinase [Microcella sp.]